jgi:NAD(P)-dependent dehydrogenase (short-subunit alcohol dehydrogenase family)
VNLKHQFFCAQAVVPGMRAAAVVQCQSRLDQLAPALHDLVLYQTCKAAIEGLTRAARELGRTTSGLIVLCPVTFERATDEMVHA